MNGIIGFLMVFVMMFIACYTSHYWFDVPPMESGLLAFLMWPIVDLGKWLLGAVLYLSWILMFGSVLTSLGF